MISNMQFSYSSPKDYRIWLNTQQSCKIYQQHTIHSIKVEMQGQQICTSLESCQATKFQQLNINLLWWCCLIILGAQYFYAKSQFQNDERAWVGGEGEGGVPECPPVRGGTGKSWRFWTQNRGTRRTFVTKSTVKIWWWWTIHHNSENLTNHFKQKLY